MSLPSRAAGRARSNACQITRQGRPRSYHAALRPYFASGWVMSELVKYTFLVVGALFPIVNPIGNTPIFLSLTRGLSERGRAALARMVAVNGLILILTSIFIGTHILAFCGISLPVVQVAGGLVVISTGWTLLRQTNDDADEKDGQRE